MQNIFFFEPEAFITVVSKIIRTLPCSSPTSFHIILLLSHCALATQGLCWFHSTCQPSSSLGPWSFSSLLDSTFSERLLTPQFNVAAQFFSILPCFNFPCHIFHLWYFSCLFTVPSHSNLNPRRVEILYSPYPQHICRMDSGTYRLPVHSR